MTLDADNRTKTENFIRLVFKTFDVSSDGSVTGEEVARVLTALGRPQVAGQYIALVNEILRSFHNIRKEALLLLWHLKLQFSKNLSRHYFNQSGVETQ